VTLVRLFEINATYPNHLRLILMAGFSTGRFPAYEQTGRSARVQAPRLSLTLLNRFNEDEKMLSIFLGYSPLLEYFRLFTDIHPATREVKPISAPWLNNTSARTTGRHTPDTLHSYTRCFFRKMSHDNTSTKKA
jgi:hypothetical protein